MPNRSRENDDALTPTRYQVIVYEVEAMQVTPKTAAGIARWCGGDVVTDIHPVDLSIMFSAVIFPTIAGAKKALDQDYVIKWTGGGFSKLTNSEFEALFRPALPEKTDV